MAQPAAEVKGAPQLQAALKRAAKDQDKAKAKASRQTAKQVREWTRAAAQGGTRLEARMAGGIGSRGDKDKAVLTVKNTARAPGAQGAFYGSKQYPWTKPWVGASWAVAQRGQGPYVINETLADRLPETEAIWLDAHAKALFDAIPGSLTRR